jgi:hypothetical protein
VDEGRIAQNSGAPNERIIASRKSRLYFRPTFRFKRPFPESGNFYGKSLIGYGVIFCYDLPARFTPAM